MYKRQATSVLNTLIKGIDSGASLDSVVGGFIGSGDKEMDIEKGGSAAEPVSYTHLELADTVGKQIDVSEGTIYPLLKRLSLIHI